MAFQILVVDNQRETIKAIRTGIQSLGTEFSVATALSGEEALLEARLKKFNLLISEVRLTGMSGVELVRKLRASKPDTKVILVSGTIDRYVRREVADVGIENVLSKPLNIPELLHEIKRVLVLGETTPPPTPEEPPVDSEPLGISDRLASLRQELSASLAILMSDTGEILMQAGDLQPLGIEAETASLTTVFSAGAKISRLLGELTPDNFYAFKGTKLNLIMTHVGESHALLIGIPSVGSSLGQMDQIYSVIQKGTHDLQAILTDMGVALIAPPEPTLGSETLLTTTDELDTLEQIFEVDQGLDALFATVDKAPVLSDIDSFWDMATVEDTGVFTSADALSYEQARQLGLAPDEEN